MNVTSTDQTNPEGNAVKTKILVPVNFSKQSEMALDFALTHAQSAHAEIYLFHVFEKKIGDFRIQDRLNEESMDRMKEMALQAIERVSTLGVVNAIEQVHRRLAHGKAATEILKMADAIAADMLIMGAPQSSAFKKFATSAPCTVVLIREKRI